MHIVQFATVNMASRINKSSEIVEERPQKHRQWKSGMVKHLLTSLKNYKIKMDYRNIDFNSDVVALYTRHGTEF